MDNTDPGTEYRRLTETYSTYNDETLIELASNPGALTELARTALRIEIARRGLTIESPGLPAASEETEEIDVGELKTIRLFRDLPEAVLAKGLLESCGIQCFLMDDNNMVRLDWFISNAIGNMRLQVRKEDAEAAIEILDHPIPDDVEDMIKE